MNNRFDQKAKEMDGNPTIRDVALKFSQVLKEEVQLTTESKLLDYGCGSGLIGMHLYKDVSSIVMLDSSAGMLELLITHYFTNRDNNGSIGEKL
ncbi:MAG: class I SAM-dependent methyltransferase [Kiritimatiellae bacterium]|jgi:ubiquinone/menaquinone biosynthesis C-methylase UbiE|nr:class I SAM-dependent methyltransferase [Kiritimatiellia bacterium]